MTSLSPEQIILTVPSGIDVGLRPDEIEARQGTFTNVTTSSITGITSINNILLKVEDLVAPPISLATLAPDPAYPATDITLTMMPKNAGAFINSRPDNTAAGGNQRGDNAVDLQMIRSAASQVASGTRSVIVGGENNTSSGLDSFIGGGASNTASGNYSFIGGGQSNTAPGLHSAIAGGNFNNCGVGIGDYVGGGFLNNATGGTSMIGGGISNTASGLRATIGGGFFNTASNTNSFVGGGFFNTAGGVSSTIAGGNNNTSPGSESTIGGGILNDASGTRSTIGGGENCLASGDYASIEGGRNNTASADYAAAGGRQAKAIHAGSRVYSDSTAADFSSTAADQYNSRYAGGYRAIGGKYSLNDTHTFYTEGSGQTIGAVTADVFTIGSTNNTTYLYSLGITAATAAGDTAVFRRSVRAKNVGGVLTVGAVFDNWLDSDAVIAGADITFIGSGTDVIARATGVAGQTINWRGCITEVQLSF